MKDLIIEIGKEQIFEDTFRLGDIEKLHILKYDIEKVIKEDGYGKGMEKYKTYINAMLPHIKEEYREYIFLYKIISSDAKSVYNLQSKCSGCGKDNSIIMTIKTNEKYPHIILENGWKINFNYLTNKTPFEDIFDSVHSIDILGTILEWDRMSDYTKECIISHVDSDLLEKLYMDMNLCRAEFEGLKEKCCDVCDSLVGDITITDGYKIFDILINSENLMILYQTNLELQTRGMSVADQMKMKPYERSIYVNMIIRKELEEKNRHENGIS